MAVKITVANKNKIKFMSFGNIIKIKIAISTAIVQFYYNKA
jgi:hypothetical protein